jgi:hypothetical protein
VTPPDVVADPSAVLADLREQLHDYGLEEEARETARKLAGEFGDLFPQLFGGDPAATAHELETLVAAALVNGAVATRVVENRFTLVGSLREFRANLPRWKDRLRLELMIARIENLTRPRR